MLISPRVPRTQVRSVTPTLARSKATFRSTVLVQEQYVRMNRFPFLYSYTAGAFSVMPLKKIRRLSLQSKLSSKLEPLTQTQTRTTDHSFVRSLLGACRCCSSCTVVDSTLILLALAACRRILTCICCPCTFLEISSRSKFCVLSQYRTVSHILQYSSIHCLCLESTRTMWTTMMMTAVAVVAWLAVTMKHAVDERICLVPSARRCMSTWLPTPRPTPTPTLLLVVV
jgi:hypothetical protein